MKLDEGEGIVDVAVCSEKDDVLLTTAAGQCIRFPVDDVRVFKGRDSMGVRGVAVAEGDSVISLAILRQFDAPSDERAAYLKMRRAMAGEAVERTAPKPTRARRVRSAALAPERYAEMSAAEQFVLTISENGYGKRTSSFEYRVTGRGGKGIVAMTVNARNGKLVASFPVEHGDEVMLVTDGGQLIRCPVEGIRIAGRATQGVIVFDTADDEQVVSVGADILSRRGRRQRAEPPLPLAGEGRGEGSSQPRLGPNTPTLLPPLRQAQEGERSEGVVARSNATKRSRRRRATRQAPETL